MYFFYQDVSASLSKKYPELYREGIRNVFFKWRVVAVWAFFSVYQSLVFYYFVTTSSDSGQNSSGKMFGIWDVSTMAFTCVVVTVNLRLLMMCNSITRWHYISVGGSISAWFIFVFVYCIIDHKVGVFSLADNFSFILLRSLSNYLRYANVFILAAEKSVLCHICLDEYLLFLPDTYASPHFCAIRRLRLPRVRK